MSIANIVITGPECSGKTTLARELSYRYKTVWIPEYARYYLSRMNEPSAYTLPDLENIVEGTLQWYNQAVGDARKIIVQDTGAIVLSVWGDISFGQRPKNLNRLPETDLYILCSPDVPYVADPLREHEHERDELYNRYLALLNESDIPFHVVSGSIEDRIQSSEKAINRMRSQRR